MKKVVYSVLIMAFLVSCGNSNQENETKVIEDQAVKNYQNMEDSQRNELKELVQKFYDQLSHPNAVNADALSRGYMSEDWVSTPLPIGGKGRAGFVKTLGIFGGMIPDLNWEIKEMYVADNVVTVRSIASGTPDSPEGHFFGVPTYGKKKFEIMTVDIHVIENGKIVKSFHVEDWATAIQQVKEDK